MTLQVIFMDAGQGDATLIQYPDGSLVLVDCGCLKNSNVVKGEIKAVLDRYLASSGNTLRALVLTHPDGDHYNLVNELLVEEDVKINKIFIGGRPEDYGNLSGWLKGRATDFEQGHCSATLVKELSMARGATYPAVDVRILSANAGNPNIKGDANPNSIVLLLSYLDVNLFLMGDSTELAENFILNTLDCGPTPAFQRLLDGKRTVLKVGHHGSYTSSCERWINSLLKYPRILGHFPS
jgi:beta-lactamase superfamily II metal-dependent hydrolase